MFGESVVSIEVRSVVAVVHLFAAGDHCCLFTLERAALTLIFDVLGEWL